MAQLALNQAFQLSGAPMGGVYRILAFDALPGIYCAARLSTKEAPVRGERLVWLTQTQIDFHSENNTLRIIKARSSSAILFNLDDKEKDRFAFRKEVMKDFLDCTKLQDHLIGHRNIATLIKKAVERTGSSRSLAYKLFAQLCEIGFTENSLRTRNDLCGGRGKLRPCDPATKRKKPGRKTLASKLSALGAIEQPGMTTVWRTLILAADSQIPSPKPTMGTRCTRILNSEFLKEYVEGENGSLVAVAAPGSFPNKKQIERVLKTHYSEVEKIKQKTTENHFKRSLRGLVGKSHEGVAGPGHTFAIDSTIGDIFLRSSANRSWIIGRPIVYIIVDIWSTAIVGFYVALAGPSWDMAKMALFSAVCPPAEMQQILGYTPILVLDPHPTLPHTLLCDRGEYLSKGAKFSASDLVLNMEYTPPYRPDLKGTVEVLHRIAKDGQFHFIPGAIDARRKEYEANRKAKSRSIFTIHSYTQYLYQAFSHYNLTANRENRLDTFMIGAGVRPSPAGLWKWGHDAGIGLQRDFPQDQLITTLLPRTNARVTKSGVRFAGLDYTCDELHTLEWSTIARNGGGWDVPIHYHVSSSRKIWTPNPMGISLLDLKIADYSNTTGNASFDEIADAKAIQTIKRAQQEHERAMHQAGHLKQLGELIKREKAANDTAIQKNSEPTPSIKETRDIELGRSQKKPEAEPKGEDDKVREEQLDHVAMLNKILEGVK